MKRLGALCVAICASTAQGLCLSPPGDLTGNGVSSVSDVQCAILVSLWQLSGTETLPECLGIPAPQADLNCDEAIGVTDILVVVQHALATPLNASVDADIDGCVDACEGTCPALVCDETGCEVGPGRWFVDAAGGSQTSDGASWAAAFSSVEAALAVAQAGERVFVAAGTYTASAAGGTVANLPAGVSLFGGFAGGECEPEERPIPLASTVLDGERDGIAGPSAGDSCHVAILHSGSVVDGVVAMRGNAASPCTGGFAQLGGGVLFEAASNAVLRNASVMLNKAGAGGGMCVNGGSGSVIDNVAFLQNTAFNGGGLEAAGCSNLQILRSSFSLNTSTGAGAGARMLNTVSTSISHSVWSANTATGNAGGLAIAGGALPQLRDCTFSGNSTGFDGGAVALTGLLGGAASTLRIINTTLHDNFAGRNGGGLFDSASAIDVVLTQCSLWENSANNDGGAIFSGLGYTLENGAVFGNTAGVGAVLSFASTPTHSFSCISGAATTGTVVGLDPAGASPFVLGADGAVYLSESNPCIDAGSDAIAASAGVECAEQSALESGVADATPCDAGRHYPIN